MNEEKPQGRGHRNDSFHLAIPLSVLAIIVAALWKVAGTPENRQIFRSQLKEVVSLKKTNEPAGARIPASASSPGRGDTSRLRDAQDAEGLVSQGMLGPDLYSKYPVISFDESPRDQSGQFDRLRVVKTEGKYPYLRIVEKWVAGRDGDQILDRKVMVADHVVVKLAPTATEAQLAALAKAKGGYIERKVSDPGRVYLIGFQAYDVSALDQMIAELSSSSVVTQSEPDYVVRR